MCKRVLALTGLGLFAAGTLGWTAAEAAVPAATLGGLAISQPTGVDVSAPVYATSAACPDSADGYNLFVYGPGGFADGLIATTTTDVGLSHESGFPIQQGLSFADIALDHQTTVVAGRYDVVANCVDSFAQQVVGTFTTVVWFTDPTHYQATDPAGGNTTTPAATPGTTTTAPAASSTPTSASTATSATTTTSPSASTTETSSAGAATTGTTAGSPGPSGLTESAAQPVSAGSPKLASTGTAAGPLAALGLGLLATGIVAVLVTRRGGREEPVRSEWPE
ncbi:hypothetical protein ORV05_11525 [Amycolatopsis cynarae]|uniref:LPXTG cell wall anchor domain-containing protein n=1 Tax=Amycolatopsis cynarae TaxID=2995223 RepID=A0ABY7BCK8_9PSEU|nr:hypothetical protein [Amycolatopsis sp. HUAS 11-8]WAL68363.1 hypothetical protein ORV05_11525 [Amycolatopsis sp. HUAS 11-8]